MERLTSPTSGPSRPNRRTPPRKSRNGGRAGIRSLLGRSAFRFVLVAGGLALALPYVLAFTPPVNSYPGAGLQGEMAPQRAVVPDARATASQQPDGKDTLNVVQSSFDPVLVERVDGIAPAMDLGMVGGSADAPVVTAEMLRILAQMTPEQIDALTFLLLSQQDPKAAAGDQADALAVEAPWVGDWTAGDIDPELADPATPETPVQNELLAGWYVFEASADEALIRNVDEPLSAIRVSPGTVLGNLGLVSEIRLEGGGAKVVLSGGDVIPSDPDAVITAESPKASEPRSVAPSQIAVAMAGSDKVALAESGTAAFAMPMTEELAAEGPSEADPVTLDEADAGATVPALTASVSLQASQAAPTESAPVEPLKSSDENDGGYVQVATFKSVENAQTAKDMLVTGGMTGVLRKTFMNGASYHMVLAGPFDPADMKTALARVTRLGFKDAFIIR